MATLTVRLDDELDATLSRLAREQGRTKSDLVREMLRRDATLRMFERARSRVLGRAERAGYVTDEDVFRDVS